MKKDPLPGALQYVHFVRIDGQPLCIVVGDRGGCRVALHGSRPRALVRRCRLPLGCEVEAGGRRYQRHERAEDDVELFDFADGDDAEYHAGQQCDDHERQQRDEQVRDAPASLVLQRPWIIGPATPRGRNVVDSPASLVRSWDRLLPDRFCERRSRRAQEHLVRVLEMADLHARQLVGKVPWSQSVPTPRHQRTERSVLHSS